MNSNMKVLQAICMASRWYRLNFIKKQQCGRPDSRLKFSLDNLSKNSIWKQSSSPDTQVYSNIGTNCD